MFSNLDPTILIEGNLGRYSGWPAGWVAGLNENKANSANQLELESGLGNTILYNIIHFNNNYIPYVVLQSHQQLQRIFSFS